MIHPWIPSGIPIWNCIAIAVLSLSWSQNSFPPLNLSKWFFPGNLSDFFAFSSSPKFSSSIFFHVFAHLNSSLWDFLGFWDFYQSSSQDSAGVFHRSSLEYLRGFHQEVFPISFQIFSLDSIRDISKRASKFKVLSDIYPSRIAF